MFAGAGKQRDFSWRRGMVVLAMFTLVVTGLNVSAHGSLWTSLAYAALMFAVGVGVLGLSWALIRATAVAATAPRDHK